MEPAAARPQGFQPAGAPPPAPAPPAQDPQRTWAMFVHLAGLAGLVLSPFGYVLGPLVVWLIKKDEMPLVDRNGRNALNFQLTVMIAMVVVMFLAFGIFFAGLAGTYWASQGRDPADFAFFGPVPFAFGVFWLVMMALLVLDIVFSIVGGIAANRGEVYRYPVAIPFFKPQA